MTARDIGMLAVGRGRLGLCALPADAGQRQALEFFHPDLVLSLTQDHEMQDAGAEDLGAWLAARGIAWHRHPIADFATPQSGPDWDATQARVQAVLDRGGRVLVHCRAGLGRSGAVALRLMVAGGEAPGDALARLRAARPGAVETEAQRLWAVQAQVERRG